MALFQSKIGWEIMRQRENKDYRYVPFLPKHIIKNSK